MKRVLQTCYLPVLFTSVLCLILWSCNDGPSGDGEHQEKKEQNAREDSLWKSVQVPEETVEPKLLVTYHLNSLNSQEEMDRFFSTYDLEQRELIFALNRIEDVRVGVGSTLVVPDTLLSDFMQYAPFPQHLNLLDTIPKVVLIHQRIQAFALYENGNLLKWGPVSSGKQSTPTPNGLFYGNYKAKRKVSTVNSDWILPYYFNFMNFEGVGVHQYLLPGFPASHACVRLYMDDAMYIYEWADQWKLDPSGNKIIENGTAFLVIGEYDFVGKVPWLTLAEDPEFENLNKEELLMLRRFLAQYLQDDRNISVETGNSTHLLQ